jgi:glutathione S-transferase
MKLLNSFVSPFAARVRLAIYAYGMPVEIAPSGQWTANYEKSPDYLAINPIGRVPTLLLDNGSALPESAVIVEYLAAEYPGSHLVPHDARSCAKARLLAHLIELYVQIPANPLTPQLFRDKPDTALVQSRVAEMSVGLGYLDHFMGRELRTTEEPITVADCALVPFLYFHAECMPRALGQPGIIDKHPNVSAYWAEIQKVPAAKKVLDEMRTAIGQSPIKRLISSGA